ncbi:MAG: hypothetical protein L6V88_08805 [Anaerotruncus sp.]|nr:MAG: hypothetical protein L6V88_08805 [Anaerotruncus sp.]
MPKERHIGLFDSFGAYACGHDADFHCRLRREGLNFYATFLFLAVYLFEALIAFVYFFRQLQA